MDSTGSSNILRDLGFSEENSAKLIGVLHGAPKLEFHSSMVIFDRDNPKSACLSLFIVAD